MIDYFPLGTASGSAFCNRKEELSQLKRNIQLVKPTLVMSPRRYGKTSLILRALAEEKIHHAHIDLYKEVDEEGVEQTIINGVGTLLGKLEPVHKKLLKLASEFFSDTHIKLNIGVEKIGFSIEMSRGLKRPADSVSHILKKLSELAEKRKIKAVLFIDEFQQLAEISKNCAIEAAIREVAQVSKNILYVFSGSNRHLLEAMFFDKNRPFYKLCDLIKVDRIADEHYYPYIKKAIKKTTDNDINNDAIGTILFLTKNHPYYVNFLCSKLAYKKELTVEIIEQCWIQCARESKAQMERELSFLSFNQRKLYIGLAKFGKNKQPSDKSTLEKMGLTSASLLQALKVLIEKDYILQDKEGYYKILDPMHKTILLVC